MRRQKWYYPPRRKAGQYFNYQRWYFKVSDFGLATDIGVSEGLEQGKTVGTPAFMSPEQCQGAALDVA